MVCAWAAAWRAGDVDHGIEARGRVSMRTARGVGMPGERVESRESGIGAGLPIRS